MFDLILYTGMILPNLELQSHLQTFVLICDMTKECYIRLPENQVLKE